MWIVGRKAGTEVVEYSSSNHWTLAKLQASIPANKGGAAGDYSYFETTEADAEKILDRWDHQVTWAAGEITGVNFANETGKPWVKLSTSKAFIANDGIETSAITLEVWKPDLSGIATGIQRTAFRVSIITPNGARFVRINIVNGIGVATFKTTVAGNYIFPQDSKRYGIMRIFNQVQIEVDDLSLLTQ